jgi:Domain of unknown function (DUF4136)
MSEWRSRRGEKHMIGKIQNKWAVFGWGFLLAMLVCSVASAQDVTTNSMPGTDFGKYHTYKWVTIEGASYPNQILDAQIKQSIDSQLAAKGLTKTDGDKAGLFIGYQVSIDQQKQWNAYGMGGGLRWGGGMASAQSSTIAIGTLVLDMYDPTNKQLVWTGRATKTLDPSNSQEKRQKNLDKAMQKLLKNFPPKS